MLPPSRLVSVLKGTAEIPWYQKILATRPANLVTFWRLNEESGTNANDSSANNLDGTYVDATLANATLDGSPVPLLDGAAGFVNVYSAGLSTKFNGAAGTIIIPVKMADVNVWSDGTHRTFIGIFNALESSYVLLKKRNITGYLQFTYNIGGTPLSLSPLSYDKETGWIVVGITWDKAVDEVKVYLQGAQVSSTLTGMGVWSGSLSSARCVIGALTTTPGELHKGWVGPTAIWDVALTAAEMLALANPLLPALAGNSTYLLSCFQNSEPERLQILTSANGVSWTHKNSRYSPLTYTRDPSIVSISGTIWMACNNKTASTFTLAKSTDGGNSFVHVSTVTVNLASVDMVYAPEWFIDDDASVHLLLCLSANSGTSYETYEMHPTNAEMTTWSDPVYIDEGDAVHAIIQDPYIVKVGATYYLWYSVGAGIYRSSSATLAGPYADVVEVFANTYEGACVIKLPSGTWRLYIDGNPGGLPGIYYSESTDAWAHWSAPVLCTATITTRHGSVIPSSGDTSFVYTEL